MLFRKNKLIFILLKFSYNLLFVYYFLFTMQNLFVVISKTYFESLSLKLFCLRQNRTLYFFFRWFVLKPANKEEKEKGGNSTTSYSQIQKNAVSPCTKSLICSNNFAKNESFYYFYLFIACMFSCFFTNILAILKRQV